MAKKILIVDDALFMRMMIKNILTKNGYEVVAEAENGLKAIEKYQQTNPDLVIMDITMPELNGIEAVRRIKRSIRTQKLLCVRQWDNVQWCSSLCRQVQETSF